jgi:hypothetical protein
VIPPSDFIAPFSFEGVKHDDNSVGPLVTFHVENFQIKAHKLILYLRGFKHSVNITYYFFDCYLGYSL